MRRAHNVGCGARVERVRSRWQTVSIMCVVGTCRPRACVFSENLEQMRDTERVQSSTSTIGLDKGLDHPRDALNL